MKSALRFLFSRRECGESLAESFTYGFLLFVVMPVLACLILVALGVTT